jgi:signal transduction histidine kinase
MLSVLTKKLITLLLLAATFIFFQGQVTNTPERAPSYAEKTDDTAGKTLSPEEKNLLIQISSDHNKLLLACLVITIFSSLLVYNLIQAKHKRERLMEGYITETRIAKKVHDEIANEIYGTLNYIASEKDITDKTREHLLAKLDDIYLLTRNISRETNNIDTGYDFPEHLKMMLTAYSGNTINIIIKGISDIDWNAVDPLKKIATYRSLQELMVNMKKHSGASLVVIDFLLKAKKIEITYTDNGKGTTEEQLLSKNGLLNIENRMISIDGRSHFDTTSGKGFHAILTYPSYSPTYVQKNFNN